MRCKLEIENTVAAMNDDGTPAKDHKYRETMHKGSEPYNALRNFHYYSLLVTRNLNAFVH